MVKIYSRFDRPATISAPDCPTDEQTYVEKIDKDGHSYLVKGDLIPFYDNIQKYKDECDVYKILRRYEDGDPDIISRLSSQGGQFGDFTDLPTDILDIKNKLNSAERLFNSLPLADREKCDNNINVFLSNLTKGILPDSLQKVLGVGSSEPVSSAVENKVETVVENKPATIQEAINGQGGNV